MQQRLQVLCDLAYTTGLPAAGIVTLRMPCSAMRTSQAALQSTRGKKVREVSGSLCVAPMANSVIQAADCMTNLQVFCR